MRNRRWSWLPVGVLSAALLTGCGDAQHPAAEHRRHPTTAPPTSGPSVPPPPDPCSLISAQDIADAFGLNGVTCDGSVAGESGSAALAAGTGLFANLTVVSRPGVGADAVDGFLAEATDGKPTQPVPGIGDRALYCVAGSSADSDSVQLSAARARSGRVFGVTLSILKRTETSPQPEMIRLVRMALSAG